MPTCPNGEIGGRNIRVLDGVVSSPHHPSFQHNGSLPWCKRAVSGFTSVAESVEGTRRIESKLHQSSARSSLNEREWKANIKKTNSNRKIFSFSHMNTLTKKKKKFPNFVLQFEFISKLCIS
jgi:hypothetical protein